MSTVWQKSRASGDRLLVLLAIADYANDDGVAWPAVSSLAIKARCSERHAQRLLNELVESRELVVERGGGRKRCNRYRVTLCQGDKITPTSCHGDQKGDICAERVTFETEKGDMHVTRSVSTRHLYPSLEEEGADAASKETESGPILPPGSPLPAPAASDSKAPLESPPVARPSQASIDGSKARWAALNARVREALEAKKRGELSDQQCLVLKKMQADLDALQKKQARGEF